MIRLGAAVFLALALITPVAAADAVKVGSLELTGLWTRATPPKAPSAGGDLTIVNTRQETDPLGAPPPPLARQAPLYQKAVKDRGTTTRAPPRRDNPSGR